MVCTLSTSVITRAEAAQSPLPVSPIRLHYLDGLRGLAAFYVVLAHIYATYYWSDGRPLPHWLLHGITWLSTGRFAVDVFILLSGYSLMLPAVRSADGQLSGGLRQFFLRRARRILPPYYAALVVVIGVSLLIPGISERVGIRRDQFLPFLTSGNLWSHLFLVQNFQARWTGAIEYPLWTIATEWHIYFIFALVLLPLWRKAGIGIVLVAALGIAVLLDHFMPWAFFHFVILFALGMAGAVINFSNDAALSRLRNGLPWGVIAAILAFPVIAFAHWRSDMADRHTLAVDTAVGVVAACLLVSCTRCLTSPERHPKSPALRLLESRWAVSLGTFSYSLYLIHALALAVVFLVLQTFHLSAAKTFVFYFGCGLTLSLLVAYGFHRLFERPFLPGHPRTKRQVVQATIVSPAP